MNIDKTNYIVFNTYKNFTWNADITMGGKRLQQVNSTRFLGVYIDHELKWCDHITTVCKKVAKNTSVLAKLKHYLPHTY